MFVYYDIVSYKRTYQCELFITYILVMLNVYAF